MKATYRLFYYISIVLTGVLAVLTLLGALAAQTIPTESRLIPLMGLILPVLLLSNLTVAIYWAIRWRCWVFIPLVAILCNWGYLTRVLKFPLSAPDSTTAVQSGTLTVVTYNADSFNKDQNGYTCKEVAEFMKRQNADIICFQEFGINTYFTEDSVRAVFSDWKYCYIPKDSTPILQIAVFSKYPIKEQQLITFPDSRNCSLWCDIDINGRPLRLFNSHLQTTEVTSNKGRLLRKLAKDDVDGAEQVAFQLSEGLYDNFKKRALQAEHLSKLINASPYPTLVCGDFNSIPSSYTYQTMKGNKLKDGFQTCGYGYMYTFHYFKRLLRIDYILHTPDIEGIDYFSPDLHYSDHNPVVMRIKL